MSPAGPAASPLLRIMPGLFVLIWSTGYIVAKFGVPYAEPFTFLALRFAFSIAVLLAVALLTGAPWPRTWAETGHALVSGVLIHGLYLGGVWWAIARGLPAGIAALIVGLQPLLTALMARRMLGEALRPAQWLGILAGFLGVGLVLAPKLAGDALAAASLAAVAATLTATLAFTLGTFYQKRFLTGADLRTGSLLQYLGALAPTAFLAAAGSPQVEWSWAFIAALAWSVLGISVGAVTLLLVLIRRGAVSRTAALIYLVPPATALQAFLLFGETLTLLQLAGMALAALGVFLVTRG